MVTGRHEIGLVAVKEELGTSFTARKSDAGNLAEVDVLLEHIRIQFGRLDILFLIAALSSPARFDTVTETQFDAIVGLYFKSTFFTIQKSLSLLSRNSSVIITTSISNQTGSLLFSVYAASKAALRSFVSKVSWRSADRTRQTC